MLHLPSVSEASLLQALRVRYNRDEIYTSAGPILMSVNPYKAISSPGGGDLYSEERMLMYRNASSGVAPAASAAAPSAANPALPCHLFQVADRAYNSLLASVASNEGEPHMEEEDALVMMERDRKQERRSQVVRNQSVVISGESGAGKKSPSTPRRGHHDADRGRAELITWCPEISTFPGSWFLSRCHAIVMLH